MPRDPNQRRLDPDIAMARPPRGFLNQVQRMALQLAVTIQEDREKFSEFQLSEHGPAQPAPGVLHLDAPTEEAAEQVREAVESWRRDPLHTPILSASVRAAIGDTTPSTANEQRLQSAMEFYRQGLISRENMVKMFGGIFSEPGIPYPDDVPTIGSQVKLESPDDRYKPKRKIEV